jgi:hypothetical protein
MSNDRTGSPACCTEMNGLRWHRGSNTMPRKQNKRKQVKVKAKRASNGSSDVAALTRMVANMQKPSSQVTDLGRLLLHGGNMLGGLVGLPSIFGSGDYKMSQNSLWSASGQVPFMHSSSESVVIRHREYITDVSMVGPSFAQTNFDINPGLAFPFPYLSNIAINFQEYKFRGLVFEYKTTSSTALTTATNTAMGKVMMAIQYRSDAAPFVNTQQLLNTMWSVDSVPSQSCLLPVECAPRENPFAIQYIREGDAPGDLKMYDLGQFTLATAGGQTGQNNVVGELWVSYEVELLKPVVTTPFLAAFQRSMGGWSNAVPNGTSATNYVNNLGITIDGNNIYIPAGTVGKYEISYRYEGNNVAFQAYPSLSHENLVFNAAVYTPVSLLNQTGGGWMHWFELNNKTLPGKYIVNSDGILPTSGGPANALSRIHITRIVPQATSEW